jgi:hypothetical protein
MPLVPTPARLKLLQACDQWPSCRTCTASYCYHCKLRPITNTEGQWNDVPACVRCPFSDRNLHSRMPLDPTHVRLKLLHACDQWHSSRKFTLLPVDTVNCVATLKALCVDTQVLTMNSTMNSTTNLMTSRNTEGP